MLVGRHDAPPVRALQHERGRRREHATGQVRGGVGVGVAGSIATNLNSETVIAQIDVEYRRLDGKSVTVPNADILVFDGDLVRDWQIYIDVAPVYA